VHGGLWLDRDKSEYAHIGRFFAEHGLATAIVNYRKSPRNPSDLVHPIHVLDFVDSLRYLYENKNGYNYDPKKVYVMGHSCGAHIISLPLLARSKYLKTDSHIIPQGIIGVEGIYDVELFLKDFPQYTPDLEFSFTKDRTLWESPQFASDPEPSKSTRWLILHSPEDTLVNNNQAVNITDHLKKLGYHDVKLEESILIIFLSYLLPVLFFCRRIHQ